MRRRIGWACVGILTLVLLCVAGCGSAPTAQPEPTPAAGDVVPAEAEVLGAGVWRCPEDLSGALFVGSVQGKTYYFPDCGQAAKILAEDRICFATSDAARAYGYGPCNSCP